MAGETFQIEAPDKKQQAEAIFDLVAMQWREDLRRHARDGRINHSHYDWKTSRIGVLGGKVVTHFGVYDTPIRIGAAMVKAAGINLVVTDPDYRKQGLMPKTIKAALEAMRENGYDLSIVCNAIPEYYTRFGYTEAWPETNYEISADELPAAQADVEPQPFTPRYTKEMDALYNQENAGITGTAVRPTFVRTKEPGDLKGLIWHDPAGRLLGYIIYDLISDGKVIWHYDSAGDVEQRLRIMGMLARRLDCDEVRFPRLPYRSALCVELRALNCYADTKYSSSGGWLIRIMNLQTLFEKLAPVLGARLAASDLAEWEGTLLISNGEEEIMLEINHVQVRVVEPASTEHSIEGQGEIAQLVIGTRPPDEIVRIAKTKLTGEAPRLVQVLFPHEYPQMGSADL